MLWICSFKEELCATVLLFSSVYVVGVLLKRNCVLQCYYSVQFMLWICSIKEELCAIVLLFSSVYVVGVLLKRNYVL